MTTMTAPAPAAGLTDPLAELTAAVAERAAARAQADRTRAVAMAAQADAALARAAYVAAGRRVGRTVRHAQRTGLRLVDLAPTAGLSPQRLHALAHASS